MFLWFSAVMLALDAARVINMRFHMIAQGKATTDEMFLMVTEKLDAMDEARAIVFRGGDAASIVESYRKVVASNVARLTT